MSRIFFSPFLIPIVAMLIPIVAIISKAWAEVQASRARADERMALIARGVPLTEIESLQKSDPTHQACATRTKDPMRSLGNARRAAISLISTGLGLMLFFCVLEQILQVREVLAGAAAGLIPLLIGIGFLVDYQLQKRELARFGLEIDPAPPK
jgi:hypothetical protein